MAEEIQEQPPIDYNDRLRARTIEIILLILLVLFLANNFRPYFTGQSPVSIQQAIMNYLVAHGWWEAIRKFAIWYIVLANILSLFFLAGIVYCAVRVRQIADEWYKRLHPEAPELEEKPKNEKWERVVAHASSANPSDWRLAILESDIILSDLLDHLNYIGDTISEKLKKVNPGDMLTLNNAWEAHKIRNAIAHEGSDFMLTQRESQRVIGLYETVFREFDYI